MHMPDVVVYAKIINTYRPNYTERQVLHVAYILLSFFLLPGDDREKKLQNKKKAGDDNNKEYQPSCHHNSCLFPIFCFSLASTSSRAARIMFYCIYFFLYYISIRTFLYLFAVVPHGWTFHIRWCCSTTVSSLLLTFQLLETVSFGVQCLLFLSVACIRNCKPSHASFRLPTMSKLAFNEKNIAQSILYEPKQATGKNAMYYVCTVSEEEYMERNNFHHIFLFLFHISSVYVHLSYRRCS